MAKLVITGSLRESMNCCTLAPKRNRTRLFVAKANNKSKRKALQYRLEQLEGEKQSVISRNKIWSGGEIGGKIQAYDIYGIMIAHGDMGKGKQHINEDVEGFEDSLKGSMGWTSSPSQHQPAGRSNAERQGLLLGEFVKLNVLCTDGKFAFGSKPR
ncbi:hypothetical protein PAAG_02689 [Paracoccidioides lutzii Pb01]|uniref:Uncharacterized protein n=1 Tax=Paracoccidioides lutzii (strain ATCC MYA-826 / Pb01) TaxID=502779 RepID=C1GVZ4_PARBA|nr:hypothetical protein PAAG_02689 [Paracoccidioides lutzii Pb01]EEH40713.1 hypothetical protein PAAG_02689 [Paracoccidioides lutzii Pb01]